MVKKEFNLNNNPKLKKIFMKFLPIISHNYKKIRIKNKN